MRRPGRTRTTKHLPGGGGPPPSKHHRAAGKHVFSGGGGPAPGKHHVPPPVQHTLSGGGGPPKRRLSVTDVNCCAVEALAASLRLTGWPVSDRDVLSLYWQVADRADEGVAITEALMAAHEYGLAGARPLGFWPAQAMAPGVILGYDLWQGMDSHAVTVCPDGIATWGEIVPMEELEPPQEMWHVSWLTTE